MSLAGVCSDMSFAEPASVGFVLIHPACGLRPTGALAGTPHIGAGVEREQAEDGEATDDDGMIADVHAVPKASGIWGIWGGVRDFAVDGDVLGIALATGRAHCRAHHASQSMLAYALP